MLLSSPSDLFRTALAPLVQQLETLGRGLEGLVNGAGTSSLSLYSFIFVKMRERK
jgi:hypothetical protein